MLGGVPDFVTLRRHTESDEATTRSGIVQVIASPVLPCPHPFPLPFSPHLRAPSLTSRCIPHSFIMYCCNFCSRQVEEASLACGSDQTPDAYRQLLSAFARTSHSPSSQWWEQLRSCLEVATAPVTHTQPLQDSLSRDVELSGVLTAVCAFRWAMAAAQRRVAKA